MFRGLAVIMFVIVSGCSMPWPHYTEVHSGQVLDAVTDKPIENAVVVYTWDRTGYDFIGSSTGQVAIYETTTDANGRYLIPSQYVELHIGLASSSIHPEEIIAYKFGYVWYHVYDNKPGSFMEVVPELKQKYQKKNNIIKLQPWNDNLSHREHIEFLENRTGFILPRPKLDEAMKQEKAIAKKEEPDINGFDRQAYQIGQKMGEDRRRFERGEIDQTQYIKLLKARLESKNVQEVASAASELNKFGDKSGIEPLIKSLKARLYRRDFGRVLGSIIRITCRDDLKCFFDNNIISERVKVIQDLEDWWRQNRKMMGNG